MSLSKPYLGLNRDKLTAFINSSNGLNLKEDVDFVYGKPYPVNNRAGVNTVTTLIPTLGSSLSQPLKVYYNRLPISVINNVFYDEIEPIMVPSVPFRIHSLLNEFNATFGTDLLPVDVVNVQCLPAQGTYTLTIDGDESLIWLPSTLVFKAITEDTQYLTDVIDLNNLDGFTQKTRHLSNVTSGDYLDGFDQTDTGLVIDLNDVISNRLSGFQLNDIDLSEVFCSDILDGFIVDGTQLISNIDSYLDGFDGGLRILRTAIYSDQSNGFGSNEEPSHQINRTKTAKQNMVDLINTEANYVFSGNEFTFSSPQAYSQESEISNTQVTLTSVPEYGFIGTKTIKYRRLELGHTFIGATTTFHVTASDNQASIEHRIAAEHNLVFGEFYLSGSIPSEGDQDTVCTLQAYGDSLLYFGTLLVTLSAGGPPPTVYKNIFQLRARTPTITYASVYVSDVPTATILGHDGNYATEEWGTSFNPAIMNGVPDRSVVSLAGLGTASGFFSTRQPAVEGSRYWEVAVLEVSPELNKFAIGMWSYLSSDFNENMYVGGGASAGGSATYYQSDGKLINNNGLIATGPALAEGDIVGIIASNPSFPNAARFYINGIFIGSADITGMPVTPIVSQMEAEL
jgi:hypothetical protein